MYLQGVQSNGLKAVQGKGMTQSEIQTIPESQSSS